MTSREPSYQLTSPLALFRVGRVLTFPLAPQGLQPALAQPLSLEIGLASMGFSTSSLSRLFEATPGLGYRFPSGPSRVAADPESRSVPRLAPAGARRDSRFR